MINRDKFLDKELFEEENHLKPDPQVQFQRAEQFFSQLPDIQLNAPKERCPQCKTQHKVFCLKCGQLLVDQAQLPQVGLPLKLRIIHHEKEKHSKSSALPLQFLSRDVEVNFFPGEITLQEDTYVLYPHVNAKFVNELSDEEIKSMKEVVAVDCTWYQTNEILEKLEKKKVKFIKLNDYQTHFWRYQHHNLKCLATVEAIYYFYKELSERIKVECDIKSLLYFYKYNFQLIKGSLDTLNGNIYKKIELKKQARLQQKVKNKNDRLFKKNI